MTEMDQLKSGIIEAVEKVRTENPLAGSVTNGLLWAVVPQWCICLMKANAWLLQVERFT